MKGLRNRTTFLFVVLLTPLAANARLVSAESVPRAQITDENVKDVASLVAGLGAFGFSGAVHIEDARGEGATFAVGFRDFERPRKMTENSVFPLASLSKQVTAAAILRLHEMDRLSVKDPIGKYLSALQEPAASATIHELLTHTSILSDYYWGTPIASLDEFFDQVNKHVSVKPDKDYQYSNLGYNLLAAVVQGASGISFERYVQEELFSPAGLTTASPEWKAAGQQDLALGYSGFYFLRPARDEYVESWTARGADGWSMTLEDLARWMRALKHGRVLKPSSVEALFTDYGNGYGYGWEVSQDEAYGRLIEHGGASFGSTIHLRWYRDLDLLVMAASNQRADLVPPALLAAVYSCRIILGEPTPPIPETADGVKEESLQGRWHFAGGEFLIWEKNDRLHMGAFGQDAIDFMAHAEPSSGADAAAASTKGEQLIRALDRGESGVKVVKFDPSLPEEVWKVEMPREWRREVHGRVSSIRSLGTAHIKASGKSRSYFDVTVDGSRHQTLTVVHDGSTVLGVEGSEPAPVTTLLAASADGGWVGWRSTIRKSIHLRLERADEGDELVLSDGKRSIRAKRIQ